MKKLASLGPWMINATFPAFHQTSAKYTPLEGIPALDIQGTYPRSGQTIHVRQLFTVRAGQIFVITTAYLEGKQNTCGPLAESVIESIQWR